MFVAGIIPFFFLFSVIMLQQTIPVPAQAALEAPTAPTALYLVAALGELLLMPAGLALYLSLKDVRKNPMLIATSLWLLATPMFLVARGLLIAISQISGRYLDSTNETMKAAYLAAAEFAIEAQSIYSYMALIFLSAASIMIGVVMFKGVYGRVTGYLLIAAGILTLFTPLGVFVAVPFVILFSGVLLSALWQVVVGIKLYRLGRVEPVGRVNREGEWVEPKFES